MCYFSFVDVIVSNFTTADVLIDVGVLIVVIVSINSSASRLANIVIIVGYTTALNVIVSVYTSRNIVIVIGVDCCTCTLGATVGGVTNGVSLFAMSIASLTFSSVGSFTFRCLRI